MSPQARSSGNSPDSAEWMEHLGELTTHAYVGCSCYQPPVEEQRLAMERLGDFLVPNGVGGRHLQELPALLEGATGLNVRSIEAVAVALFGRVCALSSDPESAPKNEPALSQRQALALLERWSRKLGVSMVPFVPAALLPALPLSGAAAHRWLELAQLEGVTSAKLLLRAPAHHHATAKFYGVNAGLSGSFQGIDRVEPHWQREFEG